MSSLRGKDFSSRGKDFVHNLCNYCRVPSFQGLCKANFQMRARTDAIGLATLLRNTALQLRCRMPLLLGAAQSCLSNASLHLALHNCLGLHLHFCTLPSTIARDCSCTSQMQACTLPFTIARDCTCTFAPCPLRLPGIAVALYALAPCTLTRVMCQREGEREMETLGRRREKKCRDALSFSLRKNNFYATNEKTRLLAQSVFARMDLSI